MPLHTRGSCSGRKGEKERGKKGRGKFQRKGTSERCGKEGREKVEGKEGKRKEERGGREGRWGEWEENSVSNTVCQGNSTIKLILILQELIL